MSQDIREYDLIELDSSDDEARRLSVTATVGPTDGEFDDSRGVQLTLETQNGYAYGRVSEPQVRDLIDVLERRLNPNELRTEATGLGSENERVQPDGSVGVDAP